MITKALNQIANHYQVRLEPFSEEINEQKGYLKINVSNPKEIHNGFHFEMSVIGINEKLNTQINDAGVFKL